MSDSSPVALPRNDQRLAGPRDPFKYVDSSAGGYIGYTGDTWRFLVQPVM